MAAAATASRRALLLSGYGSRASVARASDLDALLCSSTSSSLRGTSSYQARGGHLRGVSQLLSRANVKRAFLVDTLALVSAA